MDALKEKISQWIQPELDCQDLFLVEIKSSAGGRKLDVYIDSDTGVTINQCADVSRFLESHLDGSGLLPEDYILEVSSPGMTNPLRVPRQYRRRIGKVLEIWKQDGTFLPGILREVTDSGIVLEEEQASGKKKKKTSDGGEPTIHRLLYADIKKAFIRFHF